MEPIEYEQMYALEDSHWWYQGRQLITERLLERHILEELPPRARMVDLGCGTGMFLSRRLDRFDAFGIDFSREALSRSHHRGLRNLAQADAVRLPLRDEQFDLVTAFDLIEHVSGDRELVEEVWRVLRPGGFIMATVPAHPWLWTGHDISLHHKRRYRRSEFEALFPAERWEPLRMTSAFGFIFPMAAPVRLMRRLIWGSRRPRSDARPTYAWLNRLFIAMHRGEAHWLERHDLPEGLTLLTIGRKRTGPGYPRLWE